MCGIFAFFTRNKSLTQVSNRFRLTHLLNEAFEKGKARGPEASQIVSVVRDPDTCYHTRDCGCDNDYGCEDEVTHCPEHYLHLGFHRLAINGLTVDGMQPFSTDNDKHYLICNGEIYNYKELYAEIGVTDLSSIGSDCRVILDYYVKYGIEYTISRLQGVFSFVLIDNISQQMYVVRDRIGIRALYWGHADGKYNVCEKAEDWSRSYCVASELKQLTYLNRKSMQFSLRDDSKPLLIEMFPPGHLATINLQTGSHSLIKYWSVYESCNRLVNPSTITRSLVDILYAAVERRVNTSERPICCLLSGGLDSSLIAAMVATCSSSRGRKLRTFSIGIEGSEDLKYARIVANHINSDHTEVLVTSEEMFDAIPEVINAIETYDTTTVRASVGNYLVCKHIAQHSDAKVVFNGDGADEVMGGYLYFQVIKDYNTHRMERLRLISNLPYYDVLRSDKCISGNGLEARTPFLDPEFVRAYFEASVCHKTRMPSVEKELMRTALTDYAPFLPREVVWRRKEAFSDGVSGQSNSWSEEIKRLILERGLDKTQELVEFVDEGKTVEQAYYKMLFEQQLLQRNRVDFSIFTDDFYKRLETRWMPRFVEASDPSARTLSIYDDVSMSND